MKKINRKAQSILEYTLLIITVAGAFMAMNVYVQRAINSRIRNMQNEISPPIHIQDDIVSGNSAGNGAGQ